MPQVIVLPPRANPLQALLQAAGAYYVAKNQRAKEEQEQLRQALSAGIQAGGGMSGLQVAKMYAPPALHPHLRPYEGVGLPEPLESKLARERMAMEAEIAKKEQDYKSREFGLKEKAHALSEREVGLKMEDYKRKEREEKEKKEERERWLKEWNEFVAETLKPGATVNGVLTPQLTMKYSELEAKLPEGMTLPRSIVPMTKADLDALEARKKPTSLEIESSMENVLVDAAKQLMQSYFIAGPGSDKETAKEALQREVERTAKSVEVSVLMRGGTPEQAKSMGDSLRDRFKMKDVIKAVDVPGGGILRGTQYADYYVWQDADEIVEKWARSQATESGLALKRELADDLKKYRDALREKARAAIEAIKKKRTAGGASGAGGDDEKDKEKIDAILDIVKVYGDVIEQAMKGLNVKNSLISEEIARLHELKRYNPLNMAAEQRSAKWEAELDLRLQGIYQAQSILSNFASDAIQNIMAGREAAPVVPKAVLDLLGMRSLSFAVGGGVAETPTTAPPAAPPAAGGPGLPPPAGEGGVGPLAPISMKGFIPLPPPGAKGKRLPPSQPSLPPGTTGGLSAGAPGSTIKIRLHPSMKDVTLPARGVIGAPLPPDTLWKGAYSQIEEVRRQAAKEKDDLGKPLAVVKETIGNVAGPARPSGRYEQGLLEWKKTLKDVSAQERIVGILRNTLRRIEDFRNTSVYRQIFMELNDEYWKLSSLKKKAEDGPYPNVSPDSLLHRPFTVDNVHKSPEKIYADRIKVIQQAALANHGKNVREFAEGFGKFLQGKGWEEWLIAKAEQWLVSTKKISVRGGNVIVVGASAGER